MSVGFKYSVVGLSAFLVLGFAFAALLWPNELSMEEKLASVEEIGRLRDVARDGRRLHGAGRLKAASARYSEALEMDPDFTRVRYWRATAYLEMERYEEAGDEFAICIEAVPDSARMYNSMAVARAARGEYASAFEGLDAALELEPTFTRALDNRSLLHFHMGDHDRAMRDAKDSIAIKDGRPRPWDMLGLLYYEGGDLESALQAFDQSMQHSTRNGRFGYLNAIRNRAAVRRELGDRPGAAQDMNMYRQLKLQEKALYVPLPKEATG